MAEKIGKHKIDSNLHYQSKRLSTERAALFNSMNQDSHDTPLIKSSNFNRYENVLYRRVQHEGKQYKSGNTKVIGKFAVDLVSLRIARRLGWACTIEETDNAPIDIFAITCQRPYKIALIQVKSAFDSRGVHVNPDYLKSRRGPIWIIVATVVKSKCKKDTSISEDEIDELEGIEPDGMGYVFLIFAHSELKKFIDDYRRLFGAKADPEYAFSVPTKLKDTFLERYQNAWWKIGRNARLYA